MSDADRLREELLVARAALGVARQLDLSAVAEAFARAAQDHAQADASFLYLYDSEQDTFHLKGGHVPPDDPRRKGIVTLDLAELRGKEAHPQSWTPTVTRAPEAIRRIGVEQVLAVPLPGAGAILGMVLLSHGGGPPPPDGIERVGRLIPELVPALFNALLVERYKELIIKDDQTDSFNRRYFDRFLSEEVYRAHRYGTSLALIFLDMDNLKEINNRYGHAMGSKALREISRRLVSGIRGSDKLFRYGGDEFCVVLPETELRGACDLSERLRRSLEGRPFLADDTPGMRLTASFGVAAYPDHARTSLGLIKCADKAMQKVKASGKNSIGISEAGDEVPQAAWGPR